MGFESSDRLIYGFSQDGCRLAIEPYSRKSMRAERSGAYSINDAYPINDCLGVSLIEYGQSLRGYVRRYDMPNDFFIAASKDVDNGRVGLAIKR